MNFPLLLDSLATLAPSSRLIPPPRRAPTVVILNPRLLRVKDLNVKLKQAPAVHSSVTHAFLRALCGKSFLRSSPKLSAVNCRLSTS